VFVVHEPGRHRRFFLLLAPLVLASIVAPAGRTDAADAEPSAAQVAEGLKTIQDIAADDAAAAAANDKAKADKIDAGVEPVWKKIEDVVRGNEKDAYIAFEDGFESLAAAAKAGDATKAAKAHEAIAASVKAYVGKHPPDSPERAAESAAAPGAKSAPASASAPAGASAPAAGAPDPAPATRTAAEAGDATLARTGGASSPLAALAGAALALGGLALSAGARRRLRTR
jgi:LPXTG-motif cell wall-anchored protein